MDSLLRDLLQSDKQYAKALVNYIRRNNDDKECQVMIQKALLETRQQENAIYDSVKEVL